MSFADKYLQKHTYQSVVYDAEPHQELKMIVMIPCFNEPDIVRSLQSLWDAARPDCAVETIVIVNESELSEEVVLKQNLQSVQEIKDWQKQHVDDRFRIYVQHVKAMPKKHAGVGLARKIGMDAAVSRFNKLNRPDGIICSFDADATVAANYFVATEEHYLHFPKTTACVINFQHPVEGEEYDAFVYKGIIQYELYLRYYYQALKYAGHPHSYHTVGSSFNVKASVYCKQGGMNRRQAGEDFYFLQKVIPLGTISELNTTSVYPSPRGSDRVPFGTGATINQLIDKQQQVYLTYDFEIFKELKLLIEDIPHFHECDASDLVQIVSKYSDALKLFLDNNRFAEGVAEVKSNSTNLQSFTNRFYGWFNAFRVLKYLNFAHEGFYTRKPVGAMAAAFLKETQHADIPDNNKALLFYYRDLEQHAHVN